MAANVWTSVLVVILAAAASFALGSVVEFLLRMVGYPSSYAASMGGLVALVGFLLSVTVLAYRRFSPL